MKFIKYYHISPSSNRNSIIQNGLRESKSGLDGAGLYVWKGTLEEALKSAYFSLLDSHFYDKNYTPSNLDVWQVHLPENAKDVAGFPDYGCFKLENEYIKLGITLVGDFSELCEKI